jgi:hypothetical protein
MYLLRLFVIVHIDVHKTETECIQSPPYAVTDNCAVLRLMNSYFLIMLKAGGTHMSPTTKHMFNHVVLANWVYRDKQ